jgi:butyrate kinase
MREVLLSGRDGIHACNLSAVIADDIAGMVNAYRAAMGIEAPRCRAFIADPPMADEMLPECRVGGLPEFPRRAFLHALNSRATVRKYLYDPNSPVRDEDLYGAFQRFAPRKLQIQFFLILFQIFQKCLSHFDPPLFPGAL